MFYSVGSTVYFVESPRDSAGAFFIFKGVVESHTNDGKNKYLIKNVEFKGTQENYRKFIKNGHFKGGFELDGYVTYKKLSNISKFKFITTGTNMFRRLKDATEFRKKLEYDFILYTLKICHMISVRSLDFNEYKDVFNDLEERLNAQRVNDEIRKVKECQ